MYTVMQCLLVLRLSRPRVLLWLADPDVPAAAVCAGCVHV